jgi:hypothetical protein
VNVDQAVRYDFEFIMRALDFKIGHGIAVGIVPFVSMQWLGADGDFMPRAFLIGQSTRSQFGVIMTDTDRAVVSAKSLVMNAIAHEFSESGGWRD